MPHILGDIESHLLRTLQGTLDVTRLHHPKTSAGSIDPCAN